MRQPEWKRLGLGIASSALACVMVTVSCGARTGLDWDPKGDRTRSSTMHDLNLDGSPDQGNGGCHWPAALDYGSNETGPAQCVGGPLLLLCDVASNGISGFNNYCVSSEPSCSAISDPSCQSQCTSQEYGVLCAESTAPMAPGCRLIWPPGTPDGDGFAFCCGCL
jgi:hypothetical protein